MPPLAKLRVPAVLLLAFAGLAALPGGASAEDPAPAPAQAPVLYEQTDRDKFVSIKLPRTFKFAKESDPNSLATLEGTFGEGENAPSGVVFLGVDAQFARAVTARAMSLPRHGEVVADSLRTGAGFAEGAVLEAERPVARAFRYAERNGKVYTAQFACHKTTYADHLADIQAILDTFAVTGDAPAPPLDASFSMKKVGEFDAWSDSSDKGVVAKAIEQLSSAREVAVKSLKGKPFDESRPIARVYQNGAKFEDRGKQVFGAPPEKAAFDPIARAAMVEVMSMNAQGFDEACYSAAAGQYLWQYFGGVPPLWIQNGMPHYVKIGMLSGGKPQKPLPDLVRQTQGHVAVGKRRLDQWLDLRDWAEVTDGNQGVNELFAWHFFFRHGKGAKKYRKPYDAYFDTLRATGDPAEARKEFDGVNFDEMLQDFRAWAREWK